MKRLARTAFVALVLSAACTETQLAGPEGEQGQSMTEPIVIPGIGNSIIDGATVTLICFGRLDGVSGNDGDGGFLSVTGVVRWQSGDFVRLDCAGDERIVTGSVPGVDGPWEVFISFDDSPFEFFEGCPGVTGDGTTSRPISCLFEDIEDQIGLPESETLADFYPEYILKSGAMITIR